MNTDQERAEFESWRRRHCDFDDLDEFEIEFAFYAYKAGRAALAAQPAAVDEAIDKARFKRAPCYLCGYNGPGYYQPDTHPCAAKYHAAQPAEQLAEIKRLRAEVERLTRYYKNGVDCFATPCEKHSGERTPPFAEFFEKYGGQCLICVVDNNKALQAENERLAEALRWYAEQAAGCRKLGRDGDAARAALDADGGGRARAALEQES